FTLSRALPLRFGQAWAPPGHSVLWACEMIPPQVPIPGCRRAEHRTHDMVCTALVEGRPPWMASTGRFIHGPLYQLDRRRRIAQGHSGLKARSSGYVPDA